MKRDNNSIEKIDYILDLTRPYKNVIERNVNDTNEQYLWDGDLLGTMEEGLYLLDELGSPIRFIDRNGDTKGIFSYDEFRINIDNQNNIHNPFGYTGYEYDPISELNYAQARYYDQHQGRFISEDNITGAIGLVALGLWLWPLLGGVGLAGGGASVSILTILLSKLGLDKLMEIKSSQNCDIS